MRAIVLLEALVDEQLPDVVRPLVDREYSHFLGRDTPLEICRLRLDPALAPVVCFALSRSLKPAGYFAHLVGDAEMYVVFPGIVVTIRRGDTASLARAREVGAMFGIPRRHMRFDEMFELDHPEMHSECSDE